MKKGLIFICCFIVTLGCQKEETPTIPQEKMINILVDVHLVEASLLGFSGEQKDSLSQLYYDQIYQIHSISKDSFLTEMSFLKQHPEHLEEVYKKVIEEIDKREANLK
jgi:uncharacterized protein DUF4296